MELVKVVYEESKKLPKEEMFGLVSQMRRSAVSIPSNIAEGYGRQYRREYLRYLSNSMGSHCELETQICVCKLLNYDLKFEELEGLTASCGKQLTALYRSLSDETPSPRP